MMLITDLEKKFLASIKPSIYPIFNYAGGKQVPSPFSFQNHFNGKPTISKITVSITSFDKFILPSISKVKYIFNFQENKLNKMYG